MAGRHLYHYTVSVPAVEVPGSGAVSGQVKRGRRPGARHELALAGGCYLIAAFVVLIMVWRDPASRIVAGGPADPDQAAWWMRHAASEIAHWRTPGLITAGMNAPVGVNVMWNPSLLAPGIALSLVTLLAGPQVSLTVMLTAGFAGSATALFWVLRRWSCALVPAALGGLAYGFSPALTQSAAGHYDLQFAVLPPLIVHILLRLPRDPVRYGAWLGVLAALQLLAAEELLFYTGIAALVILAVLAARWPPLRKPRQLLETSRDLLTSVASGVLVAAGVFTLIGGFALWTQFFGPLAQHGSAYAIDFYKNDLYSFVQPSALLMIHGAPSAAFTARFTGDPAEYLGYLGWPMLLILVWAAVALWRELPIRLMAVTFAVLEVFSLGGMLLAGGRVHDWIKLPWYWLQELPVASSAITDRFSIIADGCAAALLAFALDAAWRETRRREALDLRSQRGPRLARIAIGLTGVIAILPVLPAPLPTARVEGVPAGWARTLADLHLPYGASVLTLPAPSATFTAPLRWQADTGLPTAMVGGYFIGPVGGQAYVGGTGLPAPVRYLNWLWLGSGPGIEVPPGLATSGRVVPPDQVKAWIKSSGLSAVVAVASPDSPLAYYLDNLLGARSAESGTVIGWRVRPG